MLEILGQQNDFSAHDAFVSKPYGLYCILINLHESEVEVGLKDDEGRRREDRDRNLDLRLFSKH